MFQRKKYIAFYPYSGRIDSYIDMMHRIIKKHYMTIDYIDFKDNIYDFDDIGVIYLNWFEDVMDESDRVFLQKAKRHGVRIIWVFHNKLPHEVKLQRSEKLEDIKLLIRIATGIIIHSKGSIAILKEYHPELKTEKVHYLPLIHFIDKYHDYCAELRNWMKVGGEDVLFALYGNLKPYKNIEVLIEAMCELKDFNCKLLVAGLAQRPGYVEELQRLADKAGNVKITNQYISNLQMGAFLKAADVLVLPYNTDSGMNSAVMSMAFSYRRTVVVSDIAMAHDFPDKLIYRYEYTSEKEHPASLARQLKKAYDAGRERNYEKGQELYHIVSQSCSPEIVEAGLLQLLK